MSLKTVSLLKVKQFLCKMLYPVVILFSPLQNGYKMCQKSSVVYNFVYNQCDPLHYFILEEKILLLLLCWLDGGNTLVWFNFMGPNNFFQFISNLMHC